MSKIVRIFFNRGFLPVDKTVFKIGTSLSFDCYIQRFNGFAILLEKGTFLDEKMFKKLTQDKLQVYIKNSVLKEFNLYKLEHDNKKSYSLEKVFLEEATQNALKLQETLVKLDQVEEKLRAVYFVGKNLLDSWLVDKTQKLPRKAIECIAEALVDITTQTQVSLYHFKDIIEHRYSLVTHLLNVAFFASLISSKLFLDINEKKSLILAALLHDVGKSEVDETLIDKPEMLSQKEFEEIKSHSKFSVGIAKKGGFGSQQLLLAILEHHERLDGTGYPHKLKAAQISQFGKILAVCDVFDALITIKPYRGAYTTFNALILIQNEFKNKLEMKYVKLLIKLLK
jgi:putative nucleotidyltransferase with HDIG domain